MKRYFSKVTANHWTPKNNAHKEALEVAAEMDRRIVDEDQIVKFTADFHQKIDLMNERNKRCKDLKLHNWKPGRDPVINISGVFSLTLFEINDISLSN